MSWRAAGPWNGHVYASGHTAAVLPFRSRTESERWPTAALRRHAHGAQRDRSASQRVLASRRGAHLSLPKKTRRRATRPHGRAVDARHRPVRGSGRCRPVRHVTATAPQRPMALTRPCHTPRLTRADPARSPVLSSGAPGRDDERREDGAIFSVAFVAAHGRLHA